MVIPAQIMVDQNAQIFLMGMHSNLQLCNVLLEKLTYCAPR